MQIEFTNSSIINQQKIDNQNKENCRPFLPTETWLLFRFFLLSLLLLLFLNKIIGQNNLLERQSLSINSIKQLLKTGIGQKRLVLLGEPTHGEGNVFEIKTQICKYLHDSLGFNIIAFESGLFDMFQAEEQINADPELSAKPFAANAIFNIWSSSQEFQPFLDWFDQNKTELTLLGFDPQFSSNATAAELTDLLFDYFKQLDPKFTFRPESLYKATTSFREAYSFPDDLKYDDFLTSVTAIIQELRVILEYPDIKKEQQNKGEWYLQFMKNVMMLGKDYYAKRNMNLNAENFKAYYSNSRDSMMAQNLLWLLRKYPDQKIICWGAAAHLMKNTRSIENKELQQFKPMGSYLSKELGDSALYSITFISPGGNYGSISENTRQVPVPISGSIEAMMARGLPIEFWDLHKTKFNQQLVSYPLEYTALKANWSSCFDAFICLNKFERSHFVGLKDNQQDKFVQQVGDKTNRKNLAQAPVINKNAKREIQINGTRPHQLLPNHYSGTVLDEQSNNSIPYATIQFVNKDNAIMTDAKGNFNSNQAFDSSQIIISAIGYQPKLIQIYKGQALIVRMQPLQNELIDVIVQSEHVHPEAIMDSIEQYLTYNYGTTPFIQPAYEKKQITNFDSKIFDQELVLKVIRFKGLGNARINYMHQKINKQNDHIMTSIGMPYNFGPDWTKELDFIRSGFMFTGKLRYGYKFNLKRSYFDSTLGLIYVLGFKAKRLSGKYTNGTFIASMEGELEVRKHDYAVLSIKYVTTRNVSKLQKWAKKYYNKKNKHSIWNRVPEKEAGIVEIQYHMDSSIHKYIVHYGYSQWFEQGYFMKDHHAFKLNFNFLFQDLHQTKGMFPTKTLAEKIHSYPYQLPQKDDFWENFIIPTK